MGSREAEVDLLVGRAMVSLGQTASVWLIERLWHAPLADEPRARAVGIARLIDRQLVEPSDSRLPVALRDRAERDLILAVLSDASIVDDDAPREAHALYLALARDRLRGRG